MENKNQILEIRVCGFLAAQIQVIGNDVIFSYLNNQHKSQQFLTSKIEEVYFDSMTEVEYLDDKSIIHLTNIDTSEFSLFCAKLFHQM